MSKSILNFDAMLHSLALDLAERDHSSYETHNRHNIRNRYERASNAAHGSHGSGNYKGDVLLQQINSLFYEGFGVKWSEVQQRIFKACIDACLPKIYGDEWEEAKTRVMAKRGISKMHQEVLVNMARRNGKTFVVSGAAAALFLVVPNMSVAVFSTGERAAKMLMTATLEKIDAAFTLGTHVNKQGYNLVQKNKEMLVMEHPSGGKQVFGCYPGSVRVSLLLRFFLFLFDGAPQIFHWFSAYGALLFLIGTFHNLFCTLITHTLMHAWSKHDHRVVIHAYHTFNE